MNEEEYKNQFNKIIYSSNLKYKLILKNIDNNNQYENDKQNDALIYEILYIGNYSLDIINKNLKQEEENYLYIKIQTNNSISINKFGLTNEDIELKTVPFIVHLLIIIIIIKIIHLLIPQRFQLNIIIHLLLYVFVIF